MGGSYPIVQERSLKPARRRWGLFARRDVDELPETPAGAILVFEIEGGFRAFSERRHLTGSEEAVVNAVSVSVVDVRTRSVTVEVPIPSQDLGYRFPVRVEFKCRVVEPELVVEHHVADVAAILASHLRGDVKLMQLGRNRPIEETYALIPEVSARIQAYLEVYPPEIEGMRITFAGVDLRLPDDVVVHSKGIKRLQWERESKELLVAIENRDVARIEDIFRRGPEAAAALGISREQLLMPDAVELVRKAEEQRLTHLSDLLKRLPDGALDFLPVDTHRLLNQVMKSVTGVELVIEPSDDNRPQLGGGRHARADDADGPRPIDLEDLDD
ncbi:hypothetical protein AB0K60_35045 [Thermopolyspora sp. NPDC052614]|uniref:hypothetical protein n=1 Tax=Thermopolyspora sp. NPDC052614 TaxID=3155682 RepID=UPI00341869D7